MRLRLLERIRNSLEGKTAQFNAKDVYISSLEKHLSLILNTHQGTSRSVPDFGMPDFISIMGQGDLDGIRELTRIINEVIRKYEPRLISPVVSHVPGPSENGILEFSLSGSIEIGRARHNIFFQTSIRPDGAVNVHK